MTPSLTVNAHGIPESILQSILENYNNSLHTIQNILKEHPSRILNGLSQMADTRDLVQELSLGGKTIEGNSQFFYALIGHGMPVWMFYRLWRRRSRYRPI